MTNHRQFAEKQRLYLNQFHLKTGYTMKSMNNLFDVINAHFKLQEVKRIEDEIFQIFIITLTGKTILMRPFMTDNILFLKKQISKLNNIPVEQFQFIYNGKLLEDKKKLFEYSIKTLSTIRMIFTTSTNRSPSKPRPENKLQIFLKTLTGKTIALHVQNDSTILDLKYLIREKEGIAVDQQRLLYSIRHLEDEKKLCDCGIENECTIQVCLTLRGGMYMEVSAKSDLKKLKKGKYYSESPHPNIECDHCHVVGFMGSRYHIENEDIDYCEECIKKVCDIKNQDEEDFVEISDTKRYEEESQ